MAKVQAHDLPKINQWICDKLGIPAERVHSILPTLTDGDILEANVELIDFDDLGSPFIVERYYGDQIDPKEFEELMSKEREQIQRLMS